MDSKVTVLIPTWRNLSFLKLCVESLKIAKVPFVVGVNGSDEETDRWCLANKLRYTFQENRGTYSSQNKAANIAYTDYIMTCNDDVYIAPDFNEKVEKWLDPNKIIVPKMIGGLGDFPHNFKKDKFLATKREATSVRSNFGFYIIHKDLWNKLEGYDAKNFDPGGGGNSDLLYRAIKSGIDDVIQVNDVLVYHFGRGCKRINNLTSDSNGHITNKYGFGSRELRRRLNEWCANATKLD